MSICSSEPEVLNIDSIFPGVCKRISGDLFVLWILWALWNGSGRAIMQRLIQYMVSERFFNKYIVYMTMVML